MRITFVLPAVDLSGGVKVVATYARLLTQRGHAVTVAYPQRPITWHPRSWASRARSAYRSRILAARGHFQGIEHVLHPVRVDRAGESAVAGGLTPIDLRDVPDGDAIVATYWETAYWIADYPSSKGKPFYLIQHYETWDCDAQALARMRDSWRLPMRKLVVARWLKRLAADEFDGDSAVLLHNGVDLDQFNAPQREMSDPPVIGYTYSWAPWKRSDLIADAIERVRDRLPDVRVKTFGQYRPDDRMAYPPGGEHVHQPKQSQIPGLYRAADVWVLGSDSEGFGLPILEAMACGTPVVSTACDGTVDIVQGCGGGRLVPTGDAGAMADAIVEILNDRAGWPARSEAARRRAELFRWDRACDALEATLSGTPTDFDATCPRV
ncbi:MAG: glycosyltransferase family 4 protein [Phycisphaerales bacterium]|nr:glycosyltransferase family 4 protein [Phycisphaerales bacterium]